MPHIISWLYLLQQHQMLSMRLRLLSNNGRKLLALLHNGLPTLRDKCELYRVPRGLLPCCQQERLQSVQQQLSALLLCKQQLHLLLKRLLPQQQYLHLVSKQLSLVPQLHRLRPMRAGLLRQPLGVQHLSFALHDLQLNQQLVPLLLCRLLLVL